MTKDETSPKKAHRKDTSTTQSTRQTLDSTKPVPPASLSGHNEVTQVTAHGITDGDNIQGSRVLLLYSKRSFKGKPLERRLSHARHTPGRGGSKLMAAAARRAGRRAHTTAGIKVKKEIWRGGALWQRGTCFTSWGRRVARRRRWVGAVVSSKLSPCLSVSSSSLSQPATVGSGLLSSRGSASGHSR